MAYLIHRREPLDSEIRRILTEQNHRALFLLEHWQNNPRERVHAARQTFKRLRALLHLIRPGARYVYEVENSFYRDLARSLAYVRDTEAVIEALAILEQELTDPELRESLQLVRTRLRQRAARELADPVLDVPQRVRSVCDSLRHAARRLDRTPLPDVNRKTLRTAVRKTLRRCEEGFGQVLITGAAPDFHAWRRDVKYAWHQTQLLQELMPEWATAHGPPLGRLGKLLGHSQDLTVLDALLQEQPDELGIDDRVAQLRMVILDHRDSAQAEARRLGARIFLQRVGEEPAQNEPQPAMPAQVAETPEEPSQTDGDSAAEVAEPPAQPPSADVVEFPIYRAGRENPG